jgi:ligand-binding SRPBCC domain-containing protein
MSFIQLTTFIEAPIERVFDLSRSIELHKGSMQRFNEKCAAGKQTGLLELNETVTWQAKHLMKERQLTTKITAMQKPFSFIDEQVSGDFVSLKHEHYFKPAQNGTIMIDQFYFQVPYGVIGKWVSRFYLTRYITKLLEQRNQFIKEVAESNKWKMFLS